MERTGWRRAYYTVAVLAAVLVPLAAFAAAWSVTVSRHVLLQMQIDVGAVGVANLGSPGLIALSIVCWTVIGAVARFRDRFLAVVVSAIALVACLAICMAGAYCAWLPFLCITWRLT